MDLRGVSGGRGSFSSMGCPSRLNTRPRQASPTGTLIGAPQTYQDLQRVREQIVEFVTLHSRIDRETFLSYMMATGEMASDVGTVIYGQQAVDCGLIDRVGSLSDALTALRQMINRRKKRGALRAAQAE